MFLKVSFNATFTERSRLLQVISLLQCVDFTEADVRDFFVGIICLQLLATRAVSY